MDKLIEYAPAIIEQAAKSALGLFALMILAISILGFLFFRASSEGARIGMFVLMFIGVVSFGIATFRTTSYVAPASGPAANDIDISDKWEGTVNSPVVSLRWCAPGLWNPIRQMEYKNELRLSLTFKHEGTTPSVVEEVRVLTESDAGHITWEGLYEADNAPLAENAPVAPQIEEHRTRLLPFTAPERKLLVLKTIDFVPVDHPENLKPGTYKSMLQIKDDSSDEWHELSNFLFTIPSDLALSGRDPSGVEFSAYNYWKVFKIHGR